MGRAARRSAPLTEPDCLIESGSGVLGGSGMGGAVSQPPSPNRRIAAVPASAGLTRTDSGPGTLQSTVRQGLPAIRVAAVYRLPTLASLTASIRSRRHREGAHSVQAQIMRPFRQNSIRCPRRTLVPGLVGQGSLLVVARPLEGTVSFRHPSLAVAIVPVARLPDGEMGVSTPAP